MQFIILSVFSDTDHSLALFSLTLLFKEFYLVWFKNFYRSCCRWCSCLSCRRRGCCRRCRMRRLRWSSSCSRCTMSPSPSSSDLGCQSPRWSSGAPSLMPSLWRRPQESWWRPLQEQSVVNSFFICCLVLICGWGGGGYVMDWVALIYCLFIYLILWTSLVALGSLFWHCRTQTITKQNKKQQMSNNNDDDNNNKTDVRTHTHTWEECLAHCK